MFDGWFCYIPKFDQTGFLHCFTFQQKSILFAAAAEMITLQIPTPPPTGTLYTQWPIYQKYSGHARSLAVYWDAFNKVNETFEVSFDFVETLLNCAE